MKINKKVVLLFGLIAFSFLPFVKGQKDCPAIPVKTKFDTLGYIKASVPTNPANGTGLFLGQGTVLRNGVEYRPGYIPSNRGSWAIGIAVAWNYARNLIQRVEYPQIGYWMATLIQETELRCVTGLQWSDPSHVPNAYDPNTVYAAQINNGCLQIEGPGNAYSALQQGYPNGRFPTTMYDPLIEGVDGFEASALIKAYYDIYTSQVFNYNMGWDFYKDVDCNMAVDKFSYIKVSGSAYNGGPNAFLNAKNVMGTTGCWSGLPATTAGYGNDVAKWASVFENETSYCEYPAGSTFDGYYDDALPWTEVERYLNIIKNFYPDLDFAGKVIPEVQSVFTAKAGSLGGTLNFKDFGDVIDAIVLNLPLEKPNPVEGSPIGVDLGCPGNLLPYGHVDILDGATNMCLGQSVTLELTVDAGNGTDITYKWFKGDPVNGTQIGTDKIITITPTAISTEVYSAQICNSSGCYTVYSNTQNACQDSRNLNGFNVTARDCNTCPFVASSSSTKSTCKGMTDGTVTVTLTNAPANYDVEITANTALGVTTTSTSGSGNTFTLPAVRDGSYNFIFTDASDPNCKAYTSEIVGFITAINEYVDGDFVSATNCIADVKAEIKELPAPCNWRLDVRAPTMQWSNWLNVGVKTSTGIDALSKWTDERGLWEKWYTGNFSLSTGDVIEFTTAVTPTPGATQIIQYDFKLYDENDNLVYSTSSPIGSATFNNPSTAGSYTVTCPDNVPDYTFTWSPSISNQVDTKTLSTGQGAQASTDIKYVVTAINANNPQCAIKDTVVVPGDPACNPVTSCTKPPYILLTPDTAICAGDTAKVRLSFSGAAPYKLYFTPQGLPQVEVVNITNDYYEIPADLGGKITIDSLVDNTCTNDTAKSLTITLNDLPVVDLGNDTAWCADSLVLNAGTHNTYQWNNVVSDNLQTFIANVPGLNEYTVEVTDGNGCVGRDTLNLTLNTKPQAPDLRDTILCGTGFPLTFDASVSGASYEWNDGSSSATLSANSAGDYWVIVTVNGCADTDSVSISVNGGGLVDLGTDQIICGDSATLGSTGVTFASYLWKGPGTGIKDTFPDFTARASGAYILEVTTSAGCGGSDTVEVTLNPKPVFNFPEKDTITACAVNFPVLLDATTIGASYEWNDGSAAASLNVNSEGDYWVIVTVNGCSDTDSVYVKQSSSLKVNLGNDLTVCPGQGIVLKPNVTYNNVSYSWNEGTPSFTADSFVVTTAGQVRLLIEANGCEGKDTMELFVDNPLTIDLGINRDTCAGDSIKLALLSPKQGLTYDWTVGGTTVSTDSLLMAGTLGTIPYELSVDSAGCSASASVTVTVNPLPALSLMNDTVICVGAGASFVLDAGLGMSSYLWNDGTNTSSITVTSAGDYYVDVVDGNGCVNSDTVTVTQEVASQVTLLTDNANICPLGKAVVSMDALSVAANNATWEWKNDGATNPQASYTVENRSDGDVVIVELEYTNESGCITTVDTTIIVSDQLQINGLRDTAVCEGQNILFATDFQKASNASDYTYVWQDGSTSDQFLITPVSSSSPTSISVEVTDNVQGCKGSAGPVNLTINTLPVVSLNDDTICVGQNTVLDPGVIGAATYTWTVSDGSTIPADPTANVVGIGAGSITYDVTVTDAQGCSDNASSTVLIKDKPSVQILGNTGESCIGETKLLSTGLDANLYQHQWELNAVSLTETGSSLAATQDGSYSVTVIEIATGCQDVKSTNVSFVPGPTVDLGVDSIINLCEGSDTVLINPLFRSGANYEWSTGERRTDRIIISEPGIYWLKEYVGASCSDSDGVVVIPRELPRSGLGRDTLLCFEDLLGQQLLLDTKQVNNQYSWSTGDTTRSIFVNNSGLYEVTITSEFGCETKDEIMISQECLANVWLPSSFTPNNDGINDFWSISGRGFKSVQLLVYNRWGEKVWEGNQVGDAWDGTYNGYNVAEDVYVWRITYSFATQAGKEKFRTKVGQVTIIR